MLTPTAPLDESSVPRRGRPELLEGPPGHADENVRLRPERLDQPLRWRKSRVIFVNSMSDLFHELVPLDYIQDVFEVMEKAEQHVFQILTKRHERLAGLGALIEWPRNV